MTNPLLPGEVGFTGPEWARNWGTLFNQDSPHLYLVEEPCPGRVSSLLLLSPLHLSCFSLPRGHSWQLGLAPPAPLSPSLPSAPTLFRGRSCPPPRASVKTPAPPTQEAQLPSPLALSSLPDRRAATSRLSEAPTPPPQRLLAQPSWPPAGGSSRCFLLSASALTAWILREHNFAEPGPEPEREARGLCAGETGPARSSGKTARGWRGAANTARGLGAARRLFPRGGCPARRGSRSANFLEVTPTAQAEREPDAPTRGDSMPFRHPRGREAPGWQRPVTHLKGLTPGSIGAATQQQAPLQTGRGGDETGLKAESR